MSFDPYGPLPRGTTVLEASAGTGKTWTIATLATRYVAEGVADLSQLMLATFSRAATQELRERVRARLTSTARGLVDPTCEDALVRLLRERPDADECRRRLLRALSEFDAATIATTHSFCSQVLDGLGTAGDAEPGAVVVEDVDDVVREVVDDLYLRRYAVHGEDGEDGVSPGHALTVVRAAVGDRSARLEPDGADRRSLPGQRVGLARAAREEVQRRKRAAGVRDYDDLLELLRDVLTDPVRGPQACARLQERYRVVLVDEFQDTDPVQWDVLRTAFHGSVDLVLIGDPKQAIYAFRGAEVLSYLAARDVADAVHTLDTSWRSDPGLVRALDHVHGDAALGDPRIVARPVLAGQPASRLPGQVPLTLRVVGRTGAGPLGKTGLPGVAGLRPRVAADVADEVVRLLDRRLELSVDEPHELRPADVAVLVRTHVQASLVQQALDAAGVPSVVAASTSVWATPGARDWLWLLQALEQPHRPARVRLAALTPLVGRTAAELDGDDRLLDRVGDLLRDAVRRFEEAGVAALVELLTSRTGLQERLLGQTGGERRLTDLRHVGQLLQRAAVEEQLGLSALSTWLAERVEDPQAGSSAERSRRLDSDAAAVQVVTVHGSKGLEFPVVLVPYAWDSWRPSTPEVLQLHDPTGARVLDVGGKDGPGYDERRRTAAAEDDGEELRLLYVALTRAQCAVVAWWAPSSGTRDSALHRLLLGRSGRDPDTEAVKVPEDDAALARLTAWGWPDEVAVVPAGPPQALRWTPPADEVPALEAARFDRAVDTAWRRTSYTALTSDAHAAGPAAGSEPEVPQREDEPEGAPEREADGLPSTLNAFPGGAAFGSLVHEVLERADGATGDLAGELLEHCTDAVARRLSGEDPAGLAAALLPVLRTPLAGGPALAHLPPGDRLAELDFELPLSGGDRPVDEPATLGALADLLRRHLPADDVLAGYADDLAHLSPPPLRGYLSGSIDLVLRLPGPRYVVVDHKTNRLGRGDLTTGHYTRAAMAQEMRRAHYPLQALLYAVALHRFLTWRQPGYDPERHLGGVQYLFLRGMVGPETPPGAGVFDWDLPPALVVAASELLAGR